MSALLVTIAVDLTRLWTHVYTYRLPDEVRNARRAEIESDLWDWRHDTTARGQSRPTALHLLARLICGVPDDLSWRAEHTPIPRGVVWGMTAAGLAVVFASMWMIAWVSDPGLPRLPAAPTLRMEVFLTPPPPPPPPPRYFSAPPPPPPPPPR